MEQSDLLHVRIFETVQHSPDRPAVEVAKQVWTYGKLFELAASLAATLDAAAAGVPRLTAVLASRSFTAYAGILAALLRGHAYVPISPSIPPLRVRKMLEQTEPGGLIVDRASEGILAQVLQGFERHLVIVCPDREDVSDLRQKWPTQRLLCRRDLLNSTAWKWPAVTPDDVAYVLFTSGSTGEPKGVKITHRNVARLADNLNSRYAITPADRICRLAEISFDPSVADIFTAWFSGAVLCCPVEPLTVNLPRFIVKKKISILHLVPSTAVSLQRLGMLKPNQFPNLRVTLFGGEALPVELARAWSAAAPQAILENVYGPTECTVDATAYRWDGKTGPAEAEDGIVPIGYPLPGFKLLVVDENLKEVLPGAKGELLLCGPQLAAGYLGDEARTAEAFVRPPGHDEVYYRTGDQVRRPLAGWPLVFHGRLDHQVKIFGMRIELGEIEAALRAVSGVLEVAVLGWPKTRTGVGNLVAFIGSASADVKAIEHDLRRRLPSVMVPGQIRALRQLPLNRNGKIDRRKLETILQRDACLPRAATTPP